MFSHSQILTEMSPDVSRDLTEILRKAARQPTASTQLH